MKKTNETYTIEVGTPLLRPGLKITTECSGGYTVHVARRLMELIREINREPGTEEKS